MSADGSRLLFRPLSPELRLALEERRKLRAFGRILSARIGNRRSFTCVISDDCELQHLNKTFLQRDYTTDVLSFPREEQNGELGDIAISVERAEAQAEQFGHTRIDEIRILMLHGLLHLSGLDHERDRGEMARTEQKWRRELGLPETLIARASGSGTSR